MALAAAGADVVLGCRNEEKAAVAVDDIRRRSGNDSVVSHRLDLADLGSVQAFAKELSALDRIDVLVNNAGMLLDERRETAQGFEAVFGTNHLGPFALTNLLLDQVRAAPAGRIVNVAWFGHAASVGGIRWSDIGRHRGYQEWRVYGDSKLANILHAEALARRVEGTGVVANSLHPGGVNTELRRRRRHRRPHRENAELGMARRAPDDGEVGRRGGGHVGAPRLVTGGGPGERRLLGEQQVAAPARGAAGPAMPTSCGRAPSA